MTDLVPVHKPTPASAALRAALTDAGLTLHVEQGSGGCRYVAYPDGLAVVITDRGGRLIRGTPEQWQVTIWPVNSAGDPLTDGPYVVADFNADRTTPLAKWVAGVVARIREDARTPAEPTPDPAGPEEDVVPRRPRRLRPGRHTHTSWPADRDVKIAGPNQAANGRRSYEVYVDGQRVGWARSEQVPRPAGKIRKVRTRTLWRANPSYNAQVDLTQRGGESLKHAVASLVAHWDNAHGVKRDA